MDYRSVISWTDTFLCDSSFIMISLVSGSEPFFLKKLVICHCLGIVYHTSICKKSVG